MIEVLVTIVLVTLGLLGLGGLMARFLNAEMESYQRSQALLLVQEMADRIAANRKETIGATGTSPYVTGTSSGFMGTGDSPAADCSTLTTVSAKDKCEWSKALQGSAEQRTSGGTTEKVGVMINARGCVEQVSTDPLVLRVSVAWLGQMATATPSVTCAAGLYGSNDAFRRVISLNVTVPKLLN